MAVYNIDGTSRSTLQLGLGGPKLKNSTGTFQIRNTADSAYANLEGAIFFGNLNAVGSPTYSFIGDSNTGIYSPGADSVGITTGGTLRVTVDTTAIISTVPVSNALGSNSAPAYSFTGDLNTGVYSPGADSVGITTGGTLRVTVDTTAITATLPFYAPDGSNSAPSYAIASDPNTGIYSGGADVLAITAGGVQVATFSAAGHSLLDTDAGVILNLTRNQTGLSGSQTIAQIDYKGISSASNSRTFGRIRVQATDFTDSTEDADLISSVMINGTLTAVTEVTATGLRPASTATFDLGSSSRVWNVIYGESTSARYADLAEKFEADQDYPEGTVLVIGGEKEVTTTDVFASTNVAGVVSKRPAVKMNDRPENASWPFLALSGRVPCRVVGIIYRGDRLGTSTVPGVATSIETKLHEPGSVLGIAMETYKSDHEGLINILVRPA